VIFNDGSAVVRVLRGQSLLALPPLFIIILCLRHGVQPGNLRSVREASRSAPHLPITPARRHNGVVSWNGEDHAYPSGDSFRRAGHPADGREGVRAA